MEVGKVMMVVHVCVTHVTSSFPFLIIDPFGSGSFVCLHIDSDDILIRSITQPRSIKHIQ